MVRSEEAKARKRERDRRYREEHKEKIREYKKKYKEEHRKEVRDLKKKWRRSNKEYMAKHSGIHRERTRDHVYAMLGNKCAVCGETDSRLFDIDHVNGGGNKERAALGGTYRMLRHVLKVNGEGYQILCVRCHRLKGWA